MISDRSWESLAALDGAEEAGSAFKDTSALWVNGTEIVHLDDEDVVDVRLTRGVIRHRRTKLSADPLVRLRRSSSADWVQVEVRGPDDEAHLVELVELAAEAPRVCWNDSVPTTDCCRAGIGAACTDTMIRGTATLP